MDQFGELSAVPLSYAAVGLTADAVGITVVLQVSALLIVVASLALLAVPQAIGLGRAPSGDVPRETSVAECLELICGGPWTADVPRIRARQREPAEGVHP
ncbi:hypothetical protein WEH80_35695 [Actinomycetes bacterium KLBMP 9759]